MITAGGIVSNSNPRYSCWHVLHGWPDWISRCSTAGTFPSKVFWDDLSNFNLKRSIFLT